MDLTNMAFLLRGGQIIEVKSRKELELWSFLKSLCYLGKHLSFVMVLLYLQTAEHSGIDVMCLKTLKLK